MHLRPLGRTCVAQLPRSNRNFKVAISVLILAGAADLTSPAKRRPSNADPPALSDTPGHLGIADFRVGSLSLSLSEIQEV